MFFVFTIGVYFSQNASTITEQALILAITILIISTYNLVISIVFWVKNGKRNKESYLVIYTLVSSLLVWILLIFDSPRVITNEVTTFSYFNATTFSYQTPVFETIIFTIILFSLFFIAGYIVLLAYVKNTILNSGMSKDNKGIYDVDKISSFKHFLLIIVFSLVMSFFYFAEADFSNLSSNQILVADKIIQIFHLIATSLFIPIVLSIFIEKK